ncbi:MAG: serine hydrolase [Bacteroidota bacterium]
MSLQRYLSILVCCLFINSIFAQDAADFRRAAQEALAAFDVPGFSVGVIKDGEIILAEGFGTRTQGRKESVDEHTLFAVASNTKAFVATAITHLHQEGKLDLDAPVQQYLPYFQLYDDYVSKHTTVRDLLCHRVGLGTFSGDVVWFKSELEPEQVIRQIRHLPQAYEFRAGYGYSNLMFITAGEVIKAVTGKTWAQYVQENYLTPLGMDRTQTTVNRLPKMTNVATPHITRNSNEPIPYVNWDNMGAAGGIVSSAHDMSRWMQTQLANGQFGGETIFPQGITNQTWRPHNPLRGGSQPVSTGLGWFVQYLDGHQVITHGGGYDGMYSRVKMVADEDLGVVVLTNSMTGLSSALANYIVNTYLGRATDGWLEQAVENQEKDAAAWRERRAGRRNARVRDTQPTVERSDILGAYDDPLFGTIVVKEEGEDLWLRFQTAPLLDAPLRHWHYDTYRIDWPTPQAWFDFGTVQFTLDNNRKVTGIEFDVPNDDIFFHQIHAKRVVD